MSYDFSCPICTHDILDLYPFFDTRRTHTLLTLTNCISTHTHPTLPRKRKRKTQPLAFCILQGTR